jgi:23S rRNA (uracil1939-C5)-methyltransferase
MLVMEGEDPTAPEFSVDIPISAVYTPPEANLTVMAGDDHLVYQIKDQVFQVSARSFFQINTPMAEKMVDHVLDLVHLTSDTRLIELYAGVGLFSAFLAPKVGTLTAIESSGAACHDFMINLDTLDNVILYQAEVEDVLPTLNLSPDIIIMDPPRAGLDPVVHDALIDLQPIKIVYISCDPATLARDTKKLAQKGYRLLSVTPFDVFPHTQHIECISFFEQIPED